MGFLAARMTIGCELVMPASSPPALLVGRVKPSEGVSTSAGSYRIGSWTSEPGCRAASKPIPISTPLIACTDITAWASRPSSFLSHWVCEPRPKGTPSTRTSTTPPSVSPCFARLVDQRLDFGVLVGVEGVELALGRAGPAAAASVPGWGRTAIGPTWTT